MYDRRVSLLTTLVLTLVGCASDRSDIHLMQGSASRGGADSGSDGNQAGEGPALGGQTAARSGSGGLTTGAGAAAGERPGSGGSAPRGSAGSELPGTGGADSDPGGQDPGGGAVSTGGLASGGRLTGGTSSNNGGSSGGDGGAVSTGGLASAGAGGAVSAPCTQHSDCTLYTDCCTCVALGPGESPPTSGCEGVGGMHCAVSACGSRGADTAECRDGQCVLVGSDCTASHAECSDPPPTCPADWAPNVIGGCWGVCIPQAKCGTVFVNTCDACSPDWTCVATEYPGSPRGFSCPVPPTTCSTHDCACVGASLCPSGYTCVDGPDDADVECRCPTC